MKEKIVFLETILEYLLSSFLEFINNYNKKELIELICGQMQMV